MGLDLEWCGTGMSGRAGELWNQTEKKKFMFIVLEGVDGSGKSTQIGKLRAMFEERGMASEYIHFPRFEAPFFGELIARFLRGELGGINEVDPYIVAMLYAGDRRDAAALIRRWLDTGKVVIADRYVYSNIGYQCAKVPDAARREELRRWILDLEYEYFKIPQPDISIFLDVPFAFTERKLAEAREGADREYLRGGRDIHESSLEFQKSVRDVYLDAVRHDHDLHVVDCSAAGEAMASPDEVFARIRSLVNRYVDRIGR